MIVMHPLPRVGEISIEVDSDPRGGLLPPDGIWFIRAYGSAGDGVG